MKVECEKQFKYSKFRYMKQLHFPIIIFAMVLILLSLQSCDDSSEETDPCKNGPILEINAVVATIIGQSDGMIIVSASGGKSPYLYSLDGSNFQNSDTFSSLAADDYTIVVKDNNNCTDTKVTSIKAVQEVSYANQIRPIIDGNCQVSGCHGSDSGIPSWATYNDVKSKADRIKTRTGNKSMPLVGSLSDAEISQIADWVDRGAPEN